MNLPPARTGVDNPFFLPSPLPFEAPDFSRIAVEHFMPAFEAGIAEQRAEIGRIAANPQEPDFANTLEALERSGEMLTRVQRVFSHLAAADTNPAIQQIQLEVAPRLAAHRDDIYLNPLLFQRVEKLFAAGSVSGLDDERRRLLDETHRQFVRAGAKLTSSQQSRIRAINESLALATARFQDNLLAVTRERSVLVHDVSELEGLEEPEIRAAAEEAGGHGHAGKYLLSITNTTRQPVLQRLQNRDLRRRVWEASAFRALGREGGIDNRDLVREIAALRAERASILGYENHAAYALEPQMAATAAAALDMLTGLVPAVMARIREEAVRIAAAMKADGVDDEVRPWDWEFYAGKVRSSEFGFDESEVRPYLELDAVMKDGVFFAMNRLFGIHFRERFDLPVYHPDVRIFDVLEEDGDPIGLFYADYLARPGKRGGAWMGTLVGQSHLLQKRPVIVNVMNIPRPPEGEKVLLSFDHVTTMFHEMGHAVHGLFSNVQYPSLAGTQVPRDFVEFPSTFQEDWAFHPEVLSNYARHCQTGEPMPETLVRQVLAARNFSQGFDTLEYIAAALLDMRWHSLRPGEVPADVEQFEEEVLKQMGVNLAFIPPRYRSAYFAHIWPGGYAASYYAYLWSEVLAADCFSWVQQQGGLQLAIGKRIREVVLSRGASRQPGAIFADLLGRPPAVDGLLLRRGLKSAEVQDPEKRVPANS